MIRQHYNHPSIFTWGIFNELSYKGDNPIPFVKELNSLSHKEDSTRPTAAASNQGGELKTSPILSAGIAMMVDTEACRKTLAYSSTKHKKTSNILHRY